MAKNRLITIFKGRALAAAALILCVLQLASCGLSIFGNQTQISDESTVGLTSEQNGESEGTTSGVLNSLDTESKTDDFMNESEKTADDTEAPEVAPGIIEPEETDFFTEVTEPVTESEADSETEPNIEYIGRIAFTFDDGPTVSVMEKILDKCEESGARVTFFVCGYNIGKGCHETMQRAIELGCEIGNHSTNHPNFYKLSENEIKTEIDTTDQLIKEAAGVDVTLVRPPYGNLTTETARKLEKKFILWSVDPEDWKYRDTQTVYDNVLRHVGDGDIVLLHDLYKTSYEAFCLLVDTLQEQGYQLVTVSELIEGAGTSLENGYFYYSSTYTK